ncbi:hypothetical protein EDD31_1726 [Bogoriella caseilytica]|uniref:Uncharacterized protein n=1 Tax=Bogoriella caseilytica TaxID=56055 RepID=A0A3N2BDM6_9MICO|nr:hypothetical protein EDD31_1726 [Bogoriella caseilytica]
MAKRTYHQRQKYWRRVEFSTLAILILTLGFLLYVLLT